MCGLLLPVPITAVSFHRISVYVGGVLAGCQPDIGGMREGG